MLGLHVRRGRRLMQARLNEYVFYDFGAHRHRGGDAGAGRVLKPLPPTLILYIHMQ